MGNWRIHPKEGRMCKYDPKYRASLEWCHAWQRAMRHTLSHVWLRVTPWAVARQAPLSMEFSRQEYWNGLFCPSLGELPNPGIKPGSPALQADCLPSEPPGKPRRKLSTTYSKHVSVSEQVVLFHIKNNFFNYLKRFWNVTLFMTLG